jgi:hypothetical protein
MSFRKDSAFTHALARERQAKAERDREHDRVRPGPESAARREADAGLINIERYVLEDWVMELRDAHEGKRTAGLGMVVQIADEIQGYLD